MKNRLKEAVTVFGKGGRWSGTTLLRGTGGDSCLERGRSSAESHPQLCLSGLYQGQMFGAGEQRAVEKGELSARELSALFSTVGKI